MIAGIISPAAFVIGVLIVALILFVTEVIPITATALFVCLCILAE